MTPKQRKHATRLPADYLRPRDFEYVQPLYDLAYLLEIDALSKRHDVPAYRKLALWKAALSLDGYTSNVDLWLESHATSELLDCIPSNRIRAHLTTIKETGDLPELAALRSPAHQGCLRLRALRGLGVKRIAEALRQGGLTEQWLRNATSATDLSPSVLLATWQGEAQTQWQAAHVVPPFLRLLYGFETLLGVKCRWPVSGLGNGLHPIAGELSTHIVLPPKTSLIKLTREVANRDHFFRVAEETKKETVLSHVLGWQVRIGLLKEPPQRGKSIAALATQADALRPPRKASTLRGDLHSHTNWSDGAASITEMAEAAHRNGWEYLVISDHSRSCKLQGGLTPVTWLRQAVSLSLLKPTINILHGIEVDIRVEGTLDLPAGLLDGMDIVVGSVHTAWSGDQVCNTDRILTAIGSGHIDILGHPTAMLLGTPGNPSHQRPSVAINWERIFEACKKWRVALEFNCFPSRLDLTLPLLKKASDAGCWIAFGSDAHSRAHLKHLNIALRVLPLIDSSLVLNLLPFDELKEWLSEARSLRRHNTPEPKYQLQSELLLEMPAQRSPCRISASVATHADVPSGSLIVGLDLTASKAKPTGVAVLDGLEARTCSLESDDEILAFVREQKPAIVSIDSPLGLPGGKTRVTPSAGIVRAAEHDLSSVGIPAYPALIDSMKALTLRGIKLRRQIESFPDAPKVIESYPGAAQDILCIPRKQKGLELLRAGLRELGLHGPGLDTRSHDEMDAITSAIVGRFYEVGEYEPMGIPSEAQLIVPKLRPLSFERLPVICLSGKTGVGKSVAARYLSLFFGFAWIRTRDIIRTLLIEDIHAKPKLKMFHKKVHESNIKDSDLAAFGAMLLEDYQQQPLIQKLHELVAAQKRPVVVDAIRDLADYSSLQDLDRDVMLWFVEAPDSVIQKRIALRHRRNKRPLNAIVRVDQKTSLVKRAAQHCLRNDTSLEELRWRIDDELFGIFHLTEQADDSSL